MTYPDNVDFSTFRAEDGTPDLDPNWIPISGSRSVVERVARRWLTPKGEMDDEDYGYPILRYYNANMLPVEKAALKAGLRVEALKVEGVDDCKVSLTSQGDGNFQVIGDLTLSDQTDWQLVFVLSLDTIQRITLLGTE